MKLSIVTTMYLSAPYLEEFFERVTSAAKRVTDSYEVVFVNDGSPDDALEVALRLYSTHSNVRVVDLSRNFGHHKAMMTGLEHAHGDLVFLIDCDLEEPPELLETFNRKLREQDDVDVVYGVQERRRGGLFESLTGNVFYSVFNFLSDYPIPRDLITVRLMTRRYVRNLLRHRESELLIGGLWVITGFGQIALPVRKGDKGSSSYTLSRKISMTLDSITAFSRKPLLYISLLGVLIASFAFLYTGFVVVAALVYDTPVPGYASTIASIWFLGGIIVFSVGVVGVYLSRVFVEVKNRPYTIVKSIHESASAPESPAAAAAAAELAGQSSPG